MIEKREFYHGAALLRAIEDERMRTLRPHEAGYVINDSCFVLVKYSTKTTSPWGFAVSSDDFKELAKWQVGHGTAFLALVCGGDGVCAARWDLAESLLGVAPGWLSCRRKFHERYALSGPRGDAARKIPHGRWPGILFDDE